MMIDLIQFFDNDLAYTNYYCPVSFIELNSIQSIRVSRNENYSKIGVTVNAVFYAFKEYDSAIKASIKLADLVNVNKA